MATATAGARTPIDVIEPATGAQPPLAARAAPDVAARPMRAVDRIVSYAITGISILAAIGVVIAVAFVGVPIGGWVIHSVWLAVVLGIVTFALVVGVLTMASRLMGIHAQPLGPEKTATTPP